MLQIIHIDELKTGMFVNDVVEQSGTLKIKTKGLVKSSKAIKTLLDQGVLKVEIDLSKSKLESDTSASEATEKKLKVKKASKPKLSDKEQLEQASALYDEAKTIQQRFFSRIQVNETPSLSETKALSLSIIDSVLEMPGALSCLSLLNKSGQYLLEHSLNCSILLTVFARHLKLSREEIEDLAMAGLLMDVGMVNMPADITSSSDKLTEAQREIVTTHVDIGLDLIERCGDVSETVCDVVFNHHERVDGSGYPDKQTGVDVSKYSKMAAIIDSYDAMTTNRPHQKAVPPTAAMRSLLMDKSYDQELVQAFIQCMGVHPVGSLVKLTNNRLAIVTRSNPKLPLLPVVASFYHINTGTYAESKLINLANSEIQIECSVRPEEFGINLPKFFREVFISQL